MKIFLTAAILLTLGFTTAGNEFRSIFARVTSQHFQSYANISSGFNQLPTRQSLLGVPTSFLASDSDSDFNPDILEIDNDDDGITDADELFTHFTSHNNQDTDMDGLTDPEELFTYQTNPLTGDTDMDVIPDKWEVDHMLNPLVNDADIDPDGDGDTNLQEFQNGTNPYGYVISLYKGWNLISFAGVPVDNTVTSLLEGSSADIVWYWDNQRFKVATNLESSKGYWVYAMEPAEIEIELP